MKFKADFKGGKAKTKKMQAKITTEEIRSIKPNCSMTFKCDNAGQMLSARQMTYRVGMIDGSKYTTSMDTKNNTLTITRLK